MSADGPAARWGRQHGDPRLRWARLFATAYQAARREVLEDELVVRSVLDAVGDRRRVKDQLVRAILMAVTAEVWALIGSGRDGPSDEAVAGDVATALEALAQHVRSGGFAAGRMPPVHVGYNGARTSNG